METTPSIPISPACWRKTARWVATLRQTHGVSSTPASSQRTKFRVIGGTEPAASLPTMALPAQLSGGKVSRNRVCQSRRWGVAGAWGIRRSAMGCSIFGRLCPASTHVPAWRQGSPCASRRVGGRASAAEPRGQGNGVAGLRGDLGKRLAALQRLAVAGTWGSKVWSGRTTPDRGLAIRGKGGAKTRQRHGKGTASRDTRPHPPPHWLSANGTVAVNPSSLATYTLLE